MKKIPTLFVRDPDDRAHVLPEITPGCEWALTDPTARATRKWDGTCVMLDDDGRWWARREVKADRDAPAGWWEVDSDPVTGKRTGWEPVQQSSFAKWHADAITNGVSLVGIPGTYELVGPKINGNPEQFNYHQLIRHAASPQFAMLVWPNPVPVDEAYSALRDLLRSVAEKRCEGIVWHHPDGRMVKLKGRDFKRS